ncbi:hypothetical protein DH2020_012252 [Rehmannia glutinosa]|uniref:Uncharacterized protein n=1 Tax=Rehmannia glutinosa TaxID=99300 RepID=A0ABR0X069_REHGL
MAFHHHPATATAATNHAACYCHCCYAAYTPCHHYHLPPPPEPHLHHPPHLYSDTSQIPNSHRYHDHFQEHYFDDTRRTHPTVSSLLRRIAALESALHRRRSSSQSLRDAAARTIQTQFRAFLLRRSITLRHLKDLASIKSTLGFLKSSVSEKTHFDYDVVCHEAMNLLLKLDTIQDGDPMVRNGKSCLSRELNKFLDFIDGVCVKRKGNNVKSRVSNSDRKMGNVTCGELKRVNVDKLRGLVERIDKFEELDEEQDEVIGNPNNEFMVRKRGVFTDRSGILLKHQGGFQPKVKKNVSFAENEKVYRVLRRHSEPFLEEYCDYSKRDNLVNADRELDDGFCRGNEEIGDDEEEDVRLENEGSMLNSDGEKYSEK